MPNSEEDPHFGEPDALNPAEWIQNALSMPNPEEYLHAGEPGPEGADRLNLAELMQNALNMHQEALATKIIGGDVDQRDFKEVFIRAFDALKLAPMRRGLILDLTDFDEMIAKIQKNVEFFKEKDAFVMISFVLDSCLFRRNFFLGETEQSIPALSIQRKYLDRSNKAPSGALSRNIAYTWMVQHIKPFKMSVLCDFYIGNFKQKLQKEILSTGRYLTKKDSELIRDFMKHFPNMGGMEECFELDYFVNLVPDAGHHFWAVTYDFYVSKKRELVLVELDFETFREAHLFFYVGPGSYIKINEKSVITIKNDADAAALVAFLNSRTFGYYAADTSAVNPVAFAVVLKGDVYQNLEVQKNIISAIESDYRTHNFREIELFLETNDCKRVPFAVNQMKAKRASLVQPRFDIKRFLFNIKKQNFHEHSDISSQLSLSNIIQPVAYFKTLAPLEHQRKSKGVVARDFFNQLHVVVSAEQVVETQNTQQQDKNKNQETHQEKNKAVAQQTQKNVNMTEDNEQKHKNDGSWFDFSMDFHGFAAYILDLANRQSNICGRSTLIRAYGYDYKDIYEEIVEDPEKAYKIAANIMECGYTKNKNGTYSPLFYPCSAQYVYIANVLEKHSSSSNYFWLSEYFWFYKDGFGSEKHIDGSGVLKLNGKSSMRRVIEEQTVFLKSDREHEVADLYWTVHDVPEFLNLAAETQTVIKELYQYLHSSQDEKISLLEVVKSKLESFIKGLDFSLPSDSKEGSDEEIAIKDNGDFEIQVFRELCERFPGEEIRIIDKFIAIILNQGVHNFTFFLVELRFYHDNGLMVPFYKNMFFNYEKIKKLGRKHSSDLSFINDLERVLLSGLSLHFEFCVNLPDLFCFCVSSLSGVIKNIIENDVRNDPKELIKKFSRNVIDSDLKFVFFGLSQNPLGALGQIKKFLKASQKNGYLDEQLDHLSNISLKDNDALFALEKDGFFVVSGAMGIVSAKMDLKKQSYRVVPQDLYDAIRKNCSPDMYAFRLLGIEQRRMPLSRYDAMHMSSVSDFEKALFTWVIVNSVGDAFVPAEDTDKLFMECLCYIREKNIDTAVLVEDLLESGMFSNKTWKERIQEHLPGFVFLNDQIENDVCSLDSLFSQSNQESVRALKDFLQEKPQKKEGVFLELFSSKNCFDFLKNNEEEIQKTLTSMAYSYVFEKWNKNHGKSDFNFFPDVDSAQKGTGLLMQLSYFVAKEHLKHKLAVYSSGKSEQQYNHDNKFETQLSAFKDNLEQELAKKLLFFLVRQILKEKRNMHFLTFSWISKLFANKNFKTLVENESIIVSLLHNWRLIIDKLENIDQIKLILGVLKRVSEKTQDPVKLLALMKIVAQNIEIKNVSEFINMSVSILDTIMQHPQEQVDFFVSRKLVHDLFDYYIILKKQNMTFDMMYLQIQKITVCIFKELNRLEFSKNTRIFNDLIKCDSRLQDGVLVKLFERAKTKEEKNALIEIAKSSLDLGVLKEFLSLFRKNERAVFENIEHIDRLLVKKEERSKDLCMKVILVLLKDGFSSYDLFEIIEKLEPLGEYQLRRIVQINNRPKTPEGFCYSYDAALAEHCIGQVVSKQTKKAISAPEQQQLLNDYRSVFYFLEKSPGLHALSDDVLAEKAYACRAVLTNPENSVVSKRRAELLMLAISIESFRRVTGLVARTPQIVAILTQLLHGDFLCERIMPSEGKSLVSVLAASIMWVKGMAVDVFTSDEVLAVRGHPVIKEYCDLLRIPCSNIGIDVTTPFHEYVQDGINVSTASQYALFKALNQAKFSLAAMDPKKRQKKGCVVDENDATLMACTVDNRLAFVMNPLYHQTENWAILYEIVLDFVQDEDCFIQNFCSHADDIANFKLFVSQKLKEDVSFYDRSTDILQLLQDVSDKDLDQLIEAAQIVVQHLEEGTHFSTIEKENSFFAAPIVNKRPNMSVSWSNFVQQVLHTYLNRRLSQEEKNKKKYKVEIVTDSVMTISPKEVFDDYDYIFGLTGTVGTLKEQEELYNHYGMRIYDIPTNGPRQFIKRPSILAENIKEQCRKIIECIKSDRPILIFSENVGRVEALAAELQPWFESHPEYTVQVYNGVDHAGLEARVVLEAGKPSHITITTEALGRGTDFGTTHPDGFLGINTGCHMTQRDYDQLENRVSRSQQPGEFVSIFNQEFFCCPNDVTIDEHFAMIQKNREDTEQAVRLKKIPLREVNKFFRDKMIALAYDLYVFTLHEKTKFSEKMYLEGLHDFDKKIYAAWAEYENENPIYEETQVRNFLYQLGCENFKNITGPWFGGIDSETASIIPPLDLSFFKKNRERFSAAKVQDIQEILNWSELFLNIAGLQDINEIGGKVFEKITSLIEDLETFKKSELSFSKYFLNMLFRFEIISKKDLVEGIKSLHVPINEGLSELYVSLSSVLPAFVMNRIPSLEDVQKNIVEFTQEASTIFEAEDWGRFNALFLRIEQYFSKFNTIIQWLKTANKLYSQAKWVSMLSTGGVSIIKDFGVAHVKQYAFNKMRSKILEFVLAKFSNTDSTVGKVVSLFNLLSSDECVALFNAFCHFVYNPSGTLKDLLEAFKSIINNPGVVSLLQKEPIKVENINAILEVLEKYSSLRLIDFFEPEFFVKIFNDFVSKNKEIQVFFEAHSDIQERFNSARVLSATLVDAFYGLSLKDSYAFVCLMLHPAWISAMKNVPSELTMDVVFSSLFEQENIECADPAHSVKLKAAIDALLLFLNSESAQQQRLKYFLGALKQRSIISEHDVMNFLRDKKRQNSNLFKTVEMTEGGYLFSEAVLEEKECVSADQSLEGDFVLPEYSDFIKGAHFQALVAAKQDVRNIYVRYIKQALQDPQLNQSVLQQVLLRASVDLRQVIEKIHGLENKSYFYEYKSSAVALLNAYLNKKFLSLDRRQAAEDLLYSINLANDWTQVHDVLLQTHAEILNRDLEEDKQLWRRLLGRFRNHTGTSRLLNKIDVLFLSANVLATASGEGSELEYFETSKKFLYQTVVGIKKRQSNSDLSHMADLLSTERERSWTTLFTVPNILKFVTQNGPVQALLNHAMVKAPLQYISRSGIAFPADTIQSVRPARWRTPQTLKRSLNVEKIYKHFYYLMVSASLLCSAGLFFGVSAVAAYMAGLGLAILGTAAIYIGVLWHQYRFKETQGTSVLPIPEAIPVVRTVTFTSDSSKSTNKILDEDRLKFQLVNLDGSMHAR